MGAILEARGVTKEFGGLVALDDVSFSVEPAKITAFIGPNGAGKTTLFNIIAGVYSLSSGELCLEGKHLNGLADYKRTPLGIARTFQNVLLFHNMTVLENVMVGRHSKGKCGLVRSALRTPGFRREEEDNRQKALDCLEMVGLAAKANIMAGSLTLGQQRLAAIARALATEPRILLLDEPGAGLNAVEKADLATLVKRVSDQGVTVLLVEHDMDLVMRASDWVIVLDFGKKIAEGTVHDIQKNKQVIAAYLGEELD